MNERVRRNPPNPLVFYRQERLYRHRKLNAVKLICVGVFAPRVVDSGLVDVPFLQVEGREIPNAVLVSTRN